MHILIAGGTGFTGKYLVSALLEEGHTLTLLTRSLEKGKMQFGSSVDYCERENIDSLTKTKVPIELAINLAGYPIDALPRTRKIKKKIYQSRIFTTQRLIAALPSHCHTLINASAVGYYPARSSNKWYDESYSPTRFDKPENFLQLVCFDREKAAQSFTGRVVLLRSGVILGTEKFEKIMKTQARLFGGVILGRGEQHVATIRIDQRVSAVLALIADQSFSGPINMVTQTQTQKEYITTLGKLYNKKPFIHIPKWILRRVLGDAAVLFLGNQQYISRYKEKLFH